MWVSALATATTFRNPSTRYTSYSPCSGIHTYYVYDT